MLSLLDTKDCNSSIDLYVAGSVTATWVHNRRNEGKQRERVRSAHEIDHAFTGSFLPRATIVMGS